MAPPSALPGPPFSVVLEGASNVRDLGGYRGADGRRVRRHLVYRSAALAKLTPQDLEVLGALHIRTVCDFRSVAERARAPTRLLRPERVELPIEPSVGAGLRDILRTQDATGEALHAVLEQAYVAYAIESQAQYGALFARLLAGNCPLLFHCSAGKDRTGFAAALLLTALGVAWEDVVADFSATNQLWRRDTVPAADLPASIREALLRAEPRLLEAAFAAARREYGSMERYFEQAFGLDAAALARLRDLLLEPAE